MDVKSLLNEMVYEMETVFEHGLANSFGFAERFYMFAELLVKLGMEQGSKLCKSAADSFNESRFHTTTQTAETFASLWKYIILCRDRLEYYNIKAEMEADGKN